MIRNVKIDAGNYNLTISLDENYFSDNTWKRISGNQRACPNLGVWKMGHKNGSNSHYLYLIDSGGDNILLLSELGKNAGDRGLGIFLSYKHAIARNVYLGWEIIGVKKEWLD